MALYSLPYESEHILISLEIEKLFRNYEIYRLCVSRRFEVFDAS